MQGMGDPVQVTMPLCSTVSEKEEVESKPLVGVISPPVVPVKSHNPEPVPMLIHMPLVNGARPNDSYTVPDTRLDYDTDIIGDDLDELLDRASPPESSLVSLRRATFRLLFWVRTRHVNVCLFFFFSSPRIFPQWMDLFLFRPVLPSVVQYRVLCSCLPTWAIRFWVWLHTAQ